MAEEMPARLKHTPAALSRAQLHPSTFNQSTSSQDDSECTFAPKTNPVSSKMLAAQLYLEQNPFERLATTKHVKKGSSSRDEEGYESEGGGRGRGRGSVTARGRSRSRDGRDGRDGASTHRRSHSTDARPHSADPSTRGAHGRSSSSLSNSSHSTSTASFHDFLARLKAKEFQRAQKLEQIRREEEEAYHLGRPLLSKKSAQIVAKNARQGRYESPSKRSTMPSTPAVSSTPFDPDCTFTPTINPYSKSLEGRSFDEMSQLELIRRQHILHLKQQEAMQKELEEASFKPYIHKPKGKVAEVDGRLRLLSDPDQYLSRLQFQSQLREMEQQRAAAIRQEAEMSGCTFKPVVHEAPTFVQRIAKSRQEMRKAEEERKKKIKPKPEWR